MFDIDQDDPPRAHWCGEELEVTFVANLEVTDYGVPGSPRFAEITDIEIEQLEILGVVVDPSQLNNELIEQIHALAVELDWPT